MNDRSHQVIILDGREITVRVREYSYKDQPSAKGVINLKD